MSKREEIECRLPRADGTMETAMVVYYTNEVTCPACEGTGYYTYSLSNADSRYENISADDPDSVDGWCPMCDGLKNIDKVDFTVMTPKQIEVYKRFEKNSERNQESSENLHEVFLPYKDDPYKEPID